MKRKLSLLLAVVMIITMLPMTVFARSENTVDKQPAVNDDHYFDEDNAPKLQLKLKNAVGSTDLQVFRLSLTNAEWRDKNDGKTFGTIEDNGQVGKDSPAVTLGDNFVVTEISKTVLEVTYGGAIPMDYSLWIPLICKTTDAGSVTVTVESIDGNINSGTYTFATAGSGDTKTTSSSADISDKKSALNSIIVDEVVIGAMSKLELSAGNYHTITLKVPSGFKFIKDGEVKVAGAGAYLNQVETNGNPKVEDDTITMEVRLKTGGTTRGSLVITNVFVKPESNASEGDVYLRISGTGITSETFKVGVYKTYGVSFEAANKTLPVLVTGRYEGPDSTDVEHETLEVTLKENVENSWSALRKTVFSVPDGVEIIGVDITSVKNLKSSMGSLTGLYFVSDYLGGKTGYGNSSRAYVDLEEDKLTLSDIETEGTSGKKAEISMKFYLSVSVDYTGDIDILCNGAAVGEDLTATVASTLTPITVETARNDVKIGYKSIPIQNIIITENVDGAVQRKVYQEKGSTKVRTMEIWVDSRDSDGKASSGLNFKSVGSYEVTSGNLAIDDVEVQNGVIYLTVDRESTTASTIKLSGVTMDIDRTPPEGYYNLKVGGEAIATNFTNDKTRSDESAQFGYLYSSKHAALVLNDVFNVVTAAPGSDNTWATAATVTIGSDQIVCSDGRTITMDAPAYIKDGRTMMPVRAVAVALGIADSNVWWNSETRTASVRSVNGGIVTVVMGDKNVYIGGVAVFGMDATPEIVNGRVFVPVAALADALGVAYEWNATARTVVFNSTTTTGNLSVSE